MTTFHLYKEVCFTFDEEYVPAEKATGQDDEKPSGKTLDNFGMISGRIREEFGSHVAQAFEIIYEHPRFSAEEVAAELGKTSRTAENFIAKLKQGGFIIRKGPKLGSHWEVIE